MDIKSVIIPKLESLDKAVGELRSLGDVSVQQLEQDWRTKRAVERDLQVLIEIVVDVCQRLLSVSGQTPPSTGDEAVKRCIQLGALTEHKPYREMVWFRNLIVHRYEQVDNEVLVDMLQHRLVDFERFRTEILDYVKES